MSFRTIFLCLIATALATSAGCGLAGIPPAQLEISVGSDGNYLDIEIKNATNKSVAVSQFAVDPINTGYKLYLYNSRTKELTLAWSLPQHIVDKPPATVVIRPGGVINTRVRKQYISDFFAVDPGCYFFVAKYYLNKNNRITQSSSSAPIQFCIE